ncbi:MAG: class I SAM-dependent methyltransferase [Chloroflexi bacterium]|nr:class I SAM-dependent methyltransferase [Chloroflexota bacterium]
MTLIDMRAHYERLVCCPITRQNLRLVSETDLAALNDQIVSKHLTHFDSTPVEKPLTDAFITADGTIVYPAEQNIAMLLPEFAIALSPDRFAGLDVPAYHPSVRDFYDQIGWQERDDGHFEDAHRYEDLRPVAAEYVSRTILRVNDYLPERGDYLLDVASGPIQYPDYLTYSEHYAIRVCVDVSFSALLQAQQKLPASHGLYILGNIINLPFKDSAFDAIVSLHTVYHIDGDKQHAVFDELHRVLASGGKAAVVYTWGNRTLVNLPHQVVSSVAKVFHTFFPFDKEETVVFGHPPFFYHPHKSRWFRQQRWDYPFEIVSWRSVSVQSMRMLAHERLFGKHLLRLAFALEQRFPKVMATLGQYPMFVITRV